MSTKPPTDKRWYCIAAAPNMDVRFARDLGSRRFETFVAWTFRRIKIGNRAFVEPSLRLSPYVWVSVNYSAGQDLNAVKQTLGFSSAVSLRLSDGTDLNPSEVPELVIQGLRQDQIDDFDEARRRVRIKECLYQINDRVRIIAPELFAGYEGLVTDSRPGSIIVGVGSMRLPLRLTEDDVILAKPFTGVRAA